MNRKVKTINAYTLKIEEKYIDKDVFYVSGLFRSITDEHWNKILKKAFQENDIDLIIQFRLEKKNNND